MNGHDFSTIRQSRNGRVRMIERNQKVFVQRFKSGAGRDEKDVEFTSSAFENEEMGHFYACRLFESEAEKHGKD